MGLPFQATNPVSGEKLETVFQEATKKQADTAVTQAGKAFQSFRLKSPGERAAFLETLAETVEEQADAILAYAHLETALGEERLRMEMLRTINQPRLFAELIREGSWVDARIDLPEPGRKPVPRPGMRSMLQPLGPVAVFGASNFPLAISVVGTDTICAFAAGCPVIVKAHPSHPGTCELTAEAVIKAIKAHKLPGGTFSLLHGKNHEIGQSIVRHPDLAAIAFTGSLKGGRALMDASAARERPIPVFAEMGSINPVFLLPEALRDNMESIAEGFFRSLTMGNGQFCTNPGVLVAIDSPKLDTFVERVAELIGKATPKTMLHTGIHQGYSQAVHSMCGNPGVRIRARSGVAPDPARLEAEILLLETNLENWSNSPQLRQECFGPASILVRLNEPDEIHQFANNMEGSLTATLHGTPADLEVFHRLQVLLEPKTGRIVYNGFPTGVEVGYATHHGGPYPATSTGAHTSIGIDSIHRFVAPTCYQDCPDAQLPTELKDANPLRILRKVNGRTTKETIHP